MRSVFPDGELEGSVELGAVGHQSVRIWTRQPGIATAQATLAVEGRAPVTATVSLSDKTDWIAAVDLVLDEPAPDAPFACAVGDRSLTGRLAPAPGAPSALTFGFGSCHMPFERRDGAVRVSDHAAGIYPAMADDLARANARLLLLIGDQIYADGLAGASVRDDLPGDDEHPPPPDVALAAYRRLYRGFFNQSGFRALRERFPTCCVWDDHDIFDNWGSTREKSALDRRLFDAACRSFCEYQRIRNPDAVIDAPPYDTAFIHGDIGFMLLDLRGARDAESGTMLGRDQWDRNVAWLNGDAARAVQTLFVVSSVPVAHVSRWFTTLFGLLPERVSSSVRDRWTERAFVDSRDALLSVLCEWQSRAPRRQVILLSGDVHCASAFVIRRRAGGGAIQQFTSSAMTTPLIRKQRFFNRLVVRAPNLFEPNWRFDRRFVSISNNFGVVRVEPLAGGGHRVALAIRAWAPRKRRLRTVATVVCEPSSGE